MCFDMVYVFDKEINCLFILKGDKISLWNRSVNNAEKTTSESWVNVSGVYVIKREIILCLQLYVVKRESCNEYLT